MIETQVPIEIEEIERLLLWLGLHRQHRESFGIFCLAILITAECVEERPQMKYIWQEIIRRRYHKKNPVCLSASLCRSTRELWEAGNKTRLNKVFGYELCEMPSPKILLYAIARYLKKGSKGHICAIAA